MRTRTHRLAAGAIVLDAIAVVLLGVAVAQTAFIGFFTSLLVDVIAVPIALAAAVVSGFAIVRRATRRRRLATVAVVVLSIGAVPIGFVALGAATALTPELSPNPAREAEHALGTTVEADGGRRVCSAGDPGFGPDNVQPWYVGVYEAPTSADLPAHLASRASALGFDVETGSPDVEAKQPSVSITTGSSGLTDICGGGTPAVPAGHQLIRIDASTPPRS